MPRFQLTKFPDFEGDTEVKIDVQTDHVDHLRAAFEDFLQGAGFEVQDFNFPDLNTSYNIPDPNKWMWDDKSLEVDKEYYECSEDPIQSKPKFTIVK